jgi:hypothetical protein
MGIDPQPGDEGRLVVYHPAGGEREAGVITSWNDTCVFVRYGRLRSTSKATPRDRLEWGHQ